MDASVLFRLLKKFRPKDLEKGTLVKPSIDACAGTKRKQEKEKAKASKHTMQ
jgi:hypothetical protein